MSRIQVQLEKIKYKNTDFAIAHLIENCPAHMVIRELLKNAEESAIQSNPPGKIRWFIEEVNGVRKLGLFNEGPGMSADELRQFTDMASTGKTLGVDNNFGQGGKVSALKASPAGVEFRSCKDRRVCRIVLAAERQEGVDLPVYVRRRLRVVDEQGDTWETVFDVTENYRGRADRPLDRDWTEVLLLGKRADHDTVTGLLSESERTNWLIRQINQRFYCFPNSVVVGEADVTSGQQNPRDSRGLEEVTRRHCLPTAAGTRTSRPRTRVMARWSSATAS